MAEFFLQIDTGKRTRLCYLLFALVIFAVFSPCVFNQFVWDDNTLFESELIRFTSGFWDIWSRPDKAILSDYVPLSFSVYWLEFRLWGDSPLGYHVVNLVLHIANTCLLFSLLWRLQAPAPFIVALLFAIHPMQAPVVAWVSKQKDLLYVQFYFFAFFAWLRFEEKRSLQRYLLVFFLFIAAMLCKKMAISWPVVVLIYHWWRTGRVAFRHVLFFVPFWAFAFSYSFIEYFVGTSISTSFHATWLQKTLMAGQNLCFYAYKLVWPVEHVPLVPPWSLDVRQWQLYLYVAMPSVVLLSAWCLRRRFGRGLFSAAIFFIMALFPILGFVYWSLIPKTFVQDHYLYLACIAPFMLFAFVFQTWLPRSLKFMKESQVLSHALLTIFLLPLAWLSQEHALLYKNRATLFGNNYKLYPDSCHVAKNYAEGLMEQSRYEEAEIVVDRAIQRYPDEAPIWRIKADVLFYHKQFDEARLWYAKTIEVLPDDFAVLNNYAVSILCGENPAPKKIIPLLEKALIQKPRSAAIHGNLAIALSLDGRQNEALTHFETSLQYAPQPATMILYHYAKTLLAVNQPKKALVYIQRACAIDNANPQYHALLQSVMTAQ